ncbi:two-component response regulator ARR1-like [Solanum lycopersicum]|uniref:two-component response regulator ARR1-like n=1 Tax=Solanum lycopersicum TaxID=4081 RepID=UPI0002766F94|nr:two-component response regulator ARR1-like [Solanum lycopersicum]
MASPNYGTIKEVHVLLVDNDKEFVTEMINLLKSYDYKVTTVNTSSAALSMLIREKQKFDVIIINDHSSNMLSLDLLAKAVAMDIISVVICDKYNEFVAKKVLNEGAYLYFENSFEKDIVKYLSKFVSRKKTQRQQVEEGSEINIYQNNNIIGDNGESEERQNVSNTTNQRNNIDEAGNDVGSNGKYKLTKKRERENTNEADQREHQSSDFIRRKACLVWNDDLQAKFIKVVHQIGIERCRPKKIWEQMNVLDITRTQVASHLQNYRLHWKNSEKKKSTRRSSDQRFSNSSQQISSFQKSGTIPSLQTNETNLQVHSNRTQIVPEFPFPNLKTKNTSFGGESSIQQLYRPQLHAQPYYSTICNPFNDSSQWTKTYFAGELQQQHGPLLDVLGSQGLQISNIENTSSKPTMAFNGEYHNIQSYYNMNHNVSHGASYLGSKKMSNENVGNAITNDKNLNINVDNVTTILGSRLIPDIHVGDTSTNEFSAIETNPSNIVVAKNDQTEIHEESDSDENHDCDAYFDFANIDYLSQNLESPSTDPPSE